MKPQFSNRIKAEPPAENFDMCLRDKQKRFCEEYVIDMNAAQAAIRAGYSVKASKQVASRLLTYANVQQYIADLRNEISQKTQITQELVINQIMEAHEGAISDGNWSAALKASELLGRHLGMFKDKVEHSGGIAVKWVEPEDSGGADED